MNGDEREIFVSKALLAKLAGPTRKGDSTMRFLKIIALACISSPGLLIAPCASAGTITNGSYLVGIGWDGPGTLYAPGGYGFIRLSDGYDPLLGFGAGGSDSWGASANGSYICGGPTCAGYLYQDSTSSFTANSATATTVGSNGLTVTQYFSFETTAPNILDIQETGDQHGW